jgi:multidrug efflux pump subunit AcrA (membrane-fusion protein)
MEMLKFGVTAFKAGKGMEGLIDETADQFRNQAKAMQGQPKPPPVEVQKIQAQAQAKMQELQMAAQIEMQKLQAQTENEKAKQEYQAQENQLKFQLEDQRNSKLKWKATKRFCWHILITALKLKLLVLLRGLLTVLKRLWNQSAKLRLCKTKWGIQTWQTIHFNP